jgi:hypothetical protein
VEILLSQSGSTAFITASQFFHLVSGIARKDLELAERRGSWEFAHMDLELAERRDSWEFAHMDLELAERRDSWEFAHMDLELAERRGSWEIARKDHHWDASRGLVLAVHKGLVLAVHKGLEPAVHRQRADHTEPDTETLLQLQRFVDCGVERRGSTIPKR